MMGQATRVAVTEAQSVAHHFSCDRGSWLARVTLSPVARVSPAPIVGDHRELQVSRKGLSHGNPWITPERTLARSSLSKRFVGGSWESYAGVSELGDQNRAATRLRDTEFFGTKYSDGAVVTAVLQHLAKGVPNRDNGGNLLQDNGLEWGTRSKCKQRPTHRFEDEFSPFVRRPTTGRVGFWTVDHVHQTFRNLVQSSPASALTSDGERLTWRPAREDRRVREVTRSVGTHVPLDSIELSSGARCARVRVQFDSSDRNAQPGRADVEAPRAGKKIDDPLLADRQRNCARHGSDVSRLFGRRWLRSRRIPETFFSSGHVAGDSGATDSHGSRQDFPLLSARSGRTPAT